MTTLTIKVPGEAEAKLSAFVKELGGEVISKSESKRLSKKEKLLAEIRQGLREVKDIQEGKLKPGKLSDLFDDE